MDKNNRIIITLCLTLFVAAMCAAVLAQDRARMPHRARVTALYRPFDAGVCEPWGNAVMWMEQNMTQAQLDGFVAYILPAPGEVDAYRRATDIVFKVEWLQDASDPDVAALKAAADVVQAKYEARLPADVVDVVR